MNIRKPYMTKKRKRIFDRTYSSIDEIKRYIENTEIEMEVHKKNKNLEEAYSSKIQIKKLKKALNEYESDDWLID